MINNIRFKITAGKINKILEFYTIFVPKMPSYIHRDVQSVFHLQLHKLEVSFTTLQLHYQ